MMEEIGAKVFAEIVTEGIVKAAKDLPDFAKNLKPNKINNFQEADKTLKIINSVLDGKEHPETGVEFVKKEIELPDGSLKEGVFPEFPNEFEHELDESQYESSDREQFKSCNDALRERCENDPEYAEKFSYEQFEDIVIGSITPEGYTWHHNESPGLMQLVDTELHAKTAHTGGRAFWGGGKECRN